MFDKRISVDSLLTIASVSYMSRCKHFLNSDSDEFRPYEKEVYNYLFEVANKIVPFICVDKARKLITRDIAKNSIRQFHECARAGYYNEARKKISSGIEGVFNIVLGPQMGQILDSSITEALVLIKGESIEALTQEDEFFLRVAGEKIRNLGIQNGLVKL